MGWDNGKLSKVASGACSANWHLVYSDTTMVLDTLF